MQNQKSQINALLFSKIYAEQVPHTVVLLLDKQHSIANSDEVCICSPFGLVLTGLSRGSDLLLCRALMLLFSPVAILLDYS